MQILPCEITNNVNLYTEQRVYEKAVESDNDVLDFKLAVN